MFTNARGCYTERPAVPGTLIAERAVARGHRPLLAGRDGGRLAPLADRLGLPWVEVPPDDLHRVLGDSRLVLLAAGPFASTSGPVLDASLRAGVHYLDIANEIDVNERVLAIRTERITAIPAVGFGTVASDGLARLVADHVPGADRLEIAILIGTAGSSAGARASTMAALAGGGRVRRDGRLVQTRLGAGARRLATPVGVRTAVPVPAGDLVTAYHTTRIPNITVAMTLPIPASVARVVLPAVPAVVRAGRHLPVGPPERGRPGAHHRRPALGDLRAGHARPDLGELRVGASQRRRRSGRRGLAANRRGLHLHRRVRRVRRGGRAGERAARRDDRRGGVRTGDRAFGWG